MIAILERLGCVDRWEVNAKIKGQTPESTDLGNTSLWPPKWPRDTGLNIRWTIAATISQNAKVPPLPTRKGCSP